MDKLQDLDFYCLDTDRLTKEVTEEEIQKTEFSMPSNKSTLHDVDL